MKKLSKITLFLCALFLTAAGTPLLINEAATSAKAESAIGNPPDNTPDDALNNAPHNALNNAPHNAPDNTPDDALVDAPDSFTPINKGVNIAHWLSQSSRRGEERREFFQQEDVAFIRSLGFDHIRVPIDEEQMWDEEGNKHPEAFELLHNAIEWSRQAGLKVIVDLHILRSHYFLDDSPPLYTDETALDMFLQNWRDLSGELRDYSNDLVAYEILNEPVADDPEDWNRVLHKAISEIREREQNRTIVVGSNQFNKVENFPDLRVPADDPNLILSYHFYNPMLLTHYQASWSVDVRDYDGPVQYPGRLVPEDVMENLTGQNLEIAEAQNGYYDRESMEAMMQPAFEVAEELGLHLNCGEWGVVTYAPQEERLRWYEDMRRIFEHNDISYTNWNYKSDNFGLVNMDGTRNEALIDVFTGTVGTR